uniref:Uncharacterized protein n=1 Tax=Compsopogon caeruleus TaxID=31354 RepID=A0A7S1TBW1_9RHOD|mmetsp:Transcript_16577/g.33954  ORF Transcript_16577/g.33954 Transcript_16577/m.33954 type:complete len:118 (+) Transcript_16577:131-484(+)
MGSCWEGDSVVKNHVVVNLRLPEEFLGSNHVQEPPSQTVDLGKDGRIRITKPRGLGSPRNRHGIRQYLAFGSNARNKWLPSAHSTTWSDVMLYLLQLFCFQLAAFTTFKLFIQPMFL